MIINKLLIIFLIINEYKLYICIVEMYRLV